MSYEAYLIYRWYHSDMIWYPGIARIIKNRARGSEDTVGMACQSVGDLLSLFRSGSKSLLFSVNPSDERSVLFCQYAHVLLSLFSAPTEQETARFGWLTR